MIPHKYTTTYTSGAYDIKTLITEAVIENHLKVTYSDESAYLDALVAAAWDRVEQHIGVRYGAHTLNWEARCFTHTFTLPVDAERVSAITVSFWDGDSYEDSTDVRTTNIGYPIYVEVDVDDAAAGNADKDAATVFQKAVVTVDEATPPAAVQQAFLIYLGFLYEKREAVVTGSIATELPRAYEYLLTSYRKGIYRF